MGDWVGFALALRSPDEDRLHSRVPTYLHPLAGRSLAWHGLRALAAVEAAASRLALLSASELDRAAIHDLPAEIVHVDAGSWWAAVEPCLGSGADRVLIVDAAAATLADSLASLLNGPAGRALVSPDSEPLALWLDAADAAERARGGVGGADTLHALAAGLETVVASPDESIVVRDRVSLARAARVIRDRIVRSHMEQGVSFLLPESVLVDVDVRIGPDTVIYPGVVLEGGTTIGAETVVGPGCRIIDSWIGSGVELKGWNYIVGTNIRNRAVLEPYVRRGFD